MSILDQLSSDRCTPTRVWTLLDAETRRLAATSLYDPALEDMMGRAEGDAAIAAALRFRPQAVQRMAVDKRIGHLSNRVRPGEGLATALLRALHLGPRKAMLGAFLDALGIPQADGVIDEDLEPDPPTPDALRKAIEELKTKVAPGEVDVYVATLIAMDDEFWSGLTEVVQPAD
jgi:hypothetical protein